METKICTCCAVELPIESFNANPTKSKPFRKRSRCKGCDKKVQSLYKKSNKEVLKIKALSYQRKNPDKRKDYKLRWRYGASLEIYEKLLVEQGGLCAICKTNNPVNKHKKRFCIDHNHSTGKIRGLLCDNCNKGIGCLKDSKDLVLSALEYLSKNE
jgi:hypothetical protein